jgi:hypothetical protein
MPGWLTILTEIALFLLGCSIGTELARNRSAYAREQDDCQTRVEAHWLRDVEAVAATAWERSEGDEGNEGDDGNEAAVDRGR